MTLRVTPAEVRSRADQIRQRKAQMEDIMRQMQQAVNRLPEEQWHSMSGRDYNARYQEVQRDIYGALTLILTNVDNLVQAADSYEQMESAQKQKVASLATGNIFNN